MVGDIAAATAGAVMGFDEDSVYRGEIGTDNANANFHHRPIRYRCIVPCWVGGVVEHSEGLKSKYRDDGDAGQMLATAVLL